MRNLFAILLVAVFLLQGAIPAGYMADRSESGAITAKICGWDGVWLIPIERADEGDEHDKQRADQPCVSGALAKTFVAPGEFAPLADPSPAVAPYEAYFGPQTVAARTRALPPSRAPPVTA